MQDLIDAFAKLLSVLEPELDQLSTEIRDAYADAAARLADAEQKTTNV